MKSNYFTEIVVGKPHLMVLRAMVGVDSWVVNTHMDTLRCNVKFLSTDASIGTWKDWVFWIKIDSKRYGPKVFTVTEGTKIRRDIWLHKCLKAGTDILLKEKKEFDIQNEKLTQK